MARLLDALPGGVLQIERDGSVRAANEAAHAFLGYAVDDGGQSYLVDFDPELLREDCTPLPLTEHPVIRALKRGEITGPLTLGVKSQSNDSVRWAVFRVAPVRGEDGNVSGAVVGFVDITDRKNADEALQRSEQQWRSLAQNLPDLVLIVDRDARIRSVNRPRPGRAVGEDIGLLATSDLDEDGAQQWRGHFDTAVAQKSADRFESRTMAPDGTVAWLDTILVPILSEAEVEHVVVVARDVTERRAISARLAERERLAGIGAVAASVAHEIMNPLTSVLANLESAVNALGADPERHRSALLEAVGEAKRMRQIVSDLRSLGRAGGAELFYVDLVSVIDTALRLAAPEVARATIVRDGLHEVPGVRASESRLCQVFINLLANAAQSMDDLAPEDRRIVLSSRVDHEAGFVGIDVADNGAGIPREAFARVFEPFYTTKAHGTGLGLSISADIVTKMGGRIDLQSTLGQGTTFTVWLPTTPKAP